MSLPVTRNLEQALKRSSNVPVIIMEIEGYDNLFGNVAIYKYIKIGDPGLLIGDDWVIGGFSLIENQQTNIDYDNGATTKITQKLDPAKALGSSVSQMVVSLVDRKQHATNFVSPGFQLNEVLGKSVTIYTGFKDTSWPEDYNVIFRGIIEGVDAGAAYVNLVLANVENKKRAAVLVEATAKTTTKINYHSVEIQDMFYSNKPDVPTNLFILYANTVVAGSETATVAGSTITVNIQSGVSTVSQIKKALNANPEVVSLIDFKSLNSSSSGQTAVGSTALGSSTQVTLDSITGFKLPVGSTLRTFIKIDDELLEYTGISGNTLTGLVAGEEGSTPTFHEEDQDVSMYVMLTGNAIDLALQIMLSGGPEYYIEDVPINAFVEFTADINIPNAVFFMNIDIETKYGVAVGDTFTSSGASEGDNNVTLSTVLEVGTVTNGSYVILSDDLVFENPTAAVGKFKSQYNTLTIGLKMLPKEVDVRQHLLMRDTFLPFFTLQPIFNQIREGKRFIEEELYLPVTGFSVPRKGRASMAIHTAPFPGSDVMTLDVTNVKNPEKLKVQRSIAQNFYNQVTFKLDYDVINDEFKKSIPYDAAGDIKTLITEGDVSFDIESIGLRTVNNADDLTAQAARRILKRYQRGAEFINGIDLQTRAGYRIEIGDVVAVNYSSLKLSDFYTGTRAGGVKLMEVMNKIIDNKTGAISVNVANTAFKVDERYGLISPASKITTGSTVTKIKLLKSYSTRDFQRESTKWTNYIGQTVLVHNADWSIQHETTIKGFDNQTPVGMLIDEIPDVATDGWIVCAPNYPNSTDPEELLFWKARHASFSPQVAVTASTGTPTLSFVVDVSKIAKFFVGAYVRVHNFDFSEDTEDLVDLVVEAVDTVTNTVTLSVEVGFDIDTDHYIDLIGFPDEGSAYRIL